MVNTDMISRVKAIVRRNWALLAMTGICVFAVLLRYAHLFDGSHYYIVSPDSYYFHWLAEKYRAGEQIRLVGSGAVLPLVYVAKGLSLVFRLSTSESLGLASRLLPVVLSLVTMLILYWAVRKIYDRTTALLSAFAWAGIPVGVFFGAAGNLDRDGLSFALVMVGVLLFYFSKDWKLTVWGKEVGWLAVGVAVLAVELMLYLEWNYAGPAILLAILVSYFALRILVAFTQPMLKKYQVDLLIVKDEPSVPLNRSEWKTFAAIATANGLFAGVLHDRFASYIHTILEKLGYVGQINIMEMRGLGPSDVMQFGVFLVPIAVGLFLLVIRWSPRNILLLSWFGACAFLSLFAVRILPFAAPALCVIVGVGLAGAISWARTMDLYQRVKWIAVGMLALALGANSLYFAAAFGNAPWVAPDKDWQAALSYIREDTALESRVMTWWNSGYWILDIGERASVVDNGSGGYAEAQLQDIALAYCTADPAEAAAIMRKYQASYLIFSNLERSIAQLIREYAGLEGSDVLPAGSLAILSLKGSFDSGGGLEVAYRNEEVVILRLNGDDGS